MLEKLLFVLFIFTSALLLKGLGVFKEEDTDIFVKYVIYFSLPALVFEKVRETELRSDALGVIAGAWFAILFGIALSMAVGKLLGLPSKSFRAFVLVSSFGNTAFMGYPFSFAFFGEEGLRFAVFYDQLGSFTLVITLGLLIASGKTDIRELVTFPPFISLCAGFLLKDVALPAAVETFVEVVGSSLVPVVMFAVGLKFSPSYIRDGSLPVMAALTLKMVAVPLSVLGFAKVFGLQGVAYRVVLLESAMPPMVMAGILVMKYKLDERLAVNAISLGIPIAFLTVPLLLEFL